VDASGTCSVDDDCKDPMHPTCIGGRCDVCTDSNQCTGHASGAVCAKNAGGQCVQCVGDEGCAKDSTTPICSSSNKCVGCGPVGDAGTGNGCQSNANGHQCVTSGARTGACVECLLSTQCPGGDAANPVCNTTTNKCGACVDDASCMAKDPSRPGCAKSGACVQCTLDKHCSDPTKPICDTSSNRCVPCTSDRQCVAKLGDNPGVCMSHLDGHCATDAETLYVKAGGVRCAGGSAGDGSSGSPFCRIEDGLKKTTAAKHLLLLRGPDGLAGWTTTAGPQLSVIGQAGATIGPGASIGIHITGRDVYLRGVTVTGFTESGILADMAATLRLDGCLITGNNGGVLVDGGDFAIVNTIVAANHMGLVPDGTFYGGVRLRSVAAGKLTSFRYNTVVDNEVAGLSCAGPYAVQSLLASGNGGGTTDVVMCAPDGSSRVGGDPKFDTTAGRAYHLTAASPCLDTGDPKSSPAQDIDGDDRPQPLGGKSDCGADELKR
jgi:hypothetical protein